MYSEISCSIGEDDETDILWVLQFRRRCEIAETLVERNFDLAFQVIYEFNLPGNHTHNFSFFSILVTYCFK